MFFFIQFSENNPLLVPEELLNFPLISNVQILKYLKIEAGKKFNILSHRRKLRPFCIRFTDKEQLIAACVNYAKVDDKKCRKLSRVDTFLSSDANYGAVRSKWCGKCIISPLVSRVMPKLHAPWKHHSHVNVESYRHRIAWNGD